MMKTLRFSVLVLFFLFFNSISFAQGSPGGPTCGEALAFCTADANIPFDNCYSGSSDANCTNSGESGINYGCLGSTPFPTWYFLQIDEPGDLQFRIIQNTSITDDGTPTGNELDVDFAIWGPFADTNVCGNLGSPADCSFSGAAVENARITNAQVGEIYVFLITNYNQQRGEIFITQTNSTNADSGATDCSIVAAALGPDQDVCEGTTVTLDATDSEAVNYSWEVDRGTGFVSIPGTNGMPTIDVTASGTFKVTITNADGDTGTDEVLVTFYRTPNPVGPNDITECDGTDSDGFATFDLETQTGTILNGQSATVYNVTYHLSQADASAGINGIANPSTYNSISDIIYVRVENINFTDCYDDTIEFNIVVEALPRAITPPVYELCDDAVDGDDTNGEVEFDLTTQNTLILDGQDPTQFSISYHELRSEANANVNPLPSVYLSDSKTIFARVENTNFTDCFSIASVVLQVNDLPQVNSPVLLAQCDTDTDGYAPFNLTEAQTLLSSNAVNETFLYSDSGGTVISDPTNYTNPTAVSSSVQVSVINENGCSRQAQIDLQVTASQIPPGTLYEYTSCDTDSDGIALFDFSGATAQFEALFPQDVTISYFETQQEAEAELNAITSSISAYANNSTYTDPTTGIQQIWVRVDGDTNNDCVGLGIHIELTTLDNPTFPDTVSPLEVCSPIANLATFDLTEKDSELIVDNPTDYTVTYYESIATYNANTPIANPTAFSNSSNPQIIYYSLENTVGCTTFDPEMNFEVIVNRNPEVSNPTDLQVCDEDGLDDDITTINLSVKDIEITGGFDPNLTVTYHLDNAGAVANDNSISDKSTFTNTVNPQIVEARVTNLSTGCFSTQSLQVEVFSLPVPVAPETYEVCDIDNDGVFDAFVLSSRDNEITGGDNSLSVAYYRTLDDAVNAPVGQELDANMYINNDPYNQTVFARVFNAVGCFATTSLDLVVLNTPMPNQNATPYVLCDNDADGIQIFDLETQESNILGGLNPSNYDIEWFSSLNAAENGSPAISTPTSYSSNTATVYARITNVVQSATTFCSNIAPLSLVVNPLPIPIQPAQYELCDDEASGSDTDEFSTFTLSSRNAEITGGNANWEVSYYLSQAAANAGTPSLPDTYQNVVMANQTIFVRVEDSTTGCYDTTTLTLVVNPLPVIGEPLPDALACDEDNDGFGSFDLQEYAAILSATVVDVDFTFYETLANAEANTGAGAIDTSVFYNNVTGMTSLYVVAQDTNTGTTTACEKVYQFELNVLPIPEIPTSLDTLAACDQDGDLMEMIDLTQQEAIIYGSQDPSQYTITYHINLTEAEDGINPIPNPTTYLATQTTPLQVMYVRLTTSNGTINTCPAVTSFEISVETLPTANPNNENLDLARCDEDTDTFTNFDLTGNTDLIRDNDELLMVTYYASATDLAAGIAIVNPEDYTNIENPQTIQAVLTSANGCQDATTFDIEVLPLPTPNINPNPLIVCDAITDRDADGDGTIDAGSGSDTDGFERFNLTSVISQIAGGEPVDIEIYTTLAFAEANPDDTTLAIADVTNFINTISGTQTLYARVERNVSGDDDQDNNGNLCYVVVPFEVIVNPLPVLSQETTFEYTFCEEFDGDDTRGEVDLTTLADTIGILAAPQVTSDFTITYYQSLSQAENDVVALNSPYTVVDGEVIYVRIENTVTGCFNILNIVFTVESRPEIFTTENIIQCADNLGINLIPEQGTATFDLTQQNSTITGNAATIAVRYYTSLDDAQMMENVIADPTAFVNTSNPQTIYARTINNSSGCQSSTVVDFEIFVQPIPFTDLTDEGGSICVDELTGEVLNPFTIDGSVQNPQVGVDYTYTWTLDDALISLEPTITIDAVGTYQVTILATYPDDSECEYIAQAVYSPQSAPVFEAMVVESSFNQSGLYTVEVTVVDGADPDATYEFAIDDGAFQSSTTFSNVTPGNHIVYGRLSNGACTISEVEIGIIDYPRYFTPNGDGINDTWNIIGLNVAPNLNARIYIFDRNGKLLKQISPVGIGWDGTFNGQPMPSNDYWFRVEFTEVDGQQTQRTVNGHFTLKR